MTKYTKRQYAADIAANEIYAESLKNELASYADRAEAGEDVSTFSEAWNLAYDREYELETERNDIERRWATRNWSWQDHSFNELVSANID